MKDDDILKILQDLRSDNIRQERELFKHIGVLSSASIAAFAAFNDRETVGYLSTVALWLFALAIIVSVLMIFLIVRRERKEIDKAQEAMQRIQQIRRRMMRGSLFKAFNKKNFSLGKLISLGFELYQDIVSADAEIESIKKEMTAYSKDRKVMILYHSSAFLGVGFFILAIFFMLFDIFR